VGGGGTYQIKVAPNDVSCSSVEFVGGAAVRYDGLRVLRIDNGLQSLAHSQCGGIPKCLSGKGINTQSALSCEVYRKSSGYFKNKVRTRKENGRGRGEERANDSVLRGD